MDRIGDNLLSVTNVPGESFRHRHDKVKTVLNRFCLASNVRAECEVFGAFRDLIPGHALDQQQGGLERGRGARDYYLISGLSCPLFRDSQLTS